MTDGDGEVAEVERLRAEVTGLRAENADLRTVVEQLEGVKAALHHLLLEARATGGRRRGPARHQVLLLSQPVAGSA